MAFNNSFMGTSTQYGWYEHLNESQFMQNRNAPSTQPPPPVTPAPLTSGGYTIPQIPVFHSPNMPLPLPSPHYTISESSDIPRRLEHTDRGSALVQKKPKKSTSRRSRISAEDWRIHRDHIKRLYIDEDKSLEETIEEMKSRYNFISTTKLYKERFAEWGYHKNLPKAKARWMLGKAEQRKHSEGKQDTIFIYGGQSWTMDRIQKSACRGNMHGEEQAALNAPTPHGISYKTPKNVQHSPQDLYHAAEAPQIQLEPWAPEQIQGKPDSEYLSLRWNNHSITEVDNFRREGQELERLGQLAEAEGKLRRALCGYEHLLSPTHKTTGGQAYELANFYARYDRMTEADAVLNWLSRKYTERWGMTHMQTTDHYLRILEMLDSWNREDEALVLLHRLVDTYEDSDGRMFRRSSDAGGAPNRPPPGNAQDHQEVAPRVMASTLDLPPTGNDFDPSNGLYGLSRGCPDNEDAGTEPVLNSLLERCEKHSDQFATQIIETRLSLLRLYRRQNDEERTADALERLQRACHSRMTTANMKDHSLVGALAKVGELFLKIGEHSVARRLFSEVANLVEDAVGVNNVAAINFHIRVGKIYQVGSGWNAARPWFERALAASLSRHSIDSALTESLETALEEGCYEPLQMARLGEWEAFFG